jgi:hypothetical protein
MRSREEDANTALGIAWGLWCVFAPVSLAFLVIVASSLPVRIETTGQDYRVAGFFFYVGVCGAVSVLASWYLRRLSRKGTLYPTGGRALLWLLAHAIPWFAAFVPAVKATQIYRLCGGVSWVYLGVTLTGTLLLATAPRLPVLKPAAAPLPARAPSPAATALQATTAIQATRRAATAEP